MSARKILAASSIAFACLANSAAATVHLWRIDELYSDPARPLEFIELTTTSDSQHLFKTGGNNSRLVSRETGGTVHDTFPFPNDLTTTATANRAVLIGTSNIATVGGVTPDFFIPAGFLLPGGGRLDFVSDAFGPFTSVTYPALPSGQLSYYAQAIIVGLNSPTNFAGVAGEIPLHNVWHYTPRPLDIDADTLINALDVLLIVNELNARGTRELELPAVTTMPPPYYDASDDRLISPLDVLLVVNHINEHLSQATLGSLTSPASLQLGVAAVPEPASWTLAIVAAGLLVLAARRRAITTQRV